MIKAIYKHPIVFVAFSCLLFLEIANIFFNKSIASPFVISSTIITLGYSFLCKIKSNSTLLRLSLLITTLIMILLDAPNVYFFLLSLFIILTILQINKYEETHTLFAIITLSFLLHLFYIEQTPLKIRQHDLSGILGYMNYITIGGLNWNNFIPWNMYYFFHQPLHFFLQGHLLNLFSYLFTSSIIAHESLQFISLFYTTSSTLIFIKSLKKLGFTGNILFALSILFAFNPTLTLFSGFISDDTPVLFWGTWCFYYSICWAQNHNLKNIILLALGFGLGVLTKLSLLMITPALGIFFLYQITKRKDKKATSHIAIFIIISVPISLAWVLRNHILFDMQFYNIPETSPAGQNFNLLSTFDRLTNFSMLFTPFIDAPLISEPNMLLALIKTELFGEWDLSKDNLFILPFSVVLYALNIIIKIMTFLFCIYFIAKRKQSFFSYTSLLIFTYILIWCYSINYAITYPYICSTNYRLFAIASIAEVVLLGNITKNREYSKFMLIFSILYASLSTFIYIIIA